MSLPDALKQHDPSAAWTDDDLHTAMTSAPGYDPTVLDTAWRTYVLLVPGPMSGVRGCMFDPSVQKPNPVAREGVALFSNGGYPSSESTRYMSKRSHISTRVSIATERTCGSAARNSSTSRSG